MISDILFEAVENINNYLNDPTFNKVYEGLIRDEIIALRELMDEMRQKLDAPPTVE